MGNRFLCPCSLQLDRGPVDMLSRQKNNRDMSRALKSANDFVPEPVAAAAAVARGKSERSVSPQDSLQGLFRAGWGIIVAKTRLDAFSHERMVSEIQQFRLEGCVRIALDMKGTRFLSLQTIRYLVDLSNELKSANGRLALVAPVEKARRHFEIYGSLKTISIYRSLRDLETGSVSNEGSVMVSGL